MSMRGGKNQTNKLMNIARRMNAPATKRPILTSPAGPPPKKPALLASNTVSVRKPEEIAKDKKPLFELISDWKDLAGTDIVNNSTINLFGGGEKSVLIVIRNLTDASRGDAELLQKLVQYITEDPSKCTSPYILHGLFDLFCFLDTKEQNLQVCQAITSIFRSIKSITPFMFKLILNDSCGKRFWVDFPDAAPIYYGMMNALSEFKLPPEDLYDKAELVTLKRTFVEVSDFDKKVDSTDVADLIAETLKLILQKCVEEPTKGLIRTASFLVNNAEIRKTVLKKLDAWLQAIA
uniref:Uncharacterized protein n=1 Tax=Panagrolaimus sp. JU765 TaxID=591449 RepID=A0AC34R2R3_9BILA